MINGHCFCFACVYYGVCVLRSSGDRFQEWVSLTPLFFCYYKVEKTNERRGPHLKSFWPAVGGEKWRPVQQLSWVERKALGAWRPRLEFTGQRTRKKTDGGTWETQWYWHCILGICKTVLQLTWICAHTRRKTTLGRDCREGWQKPGTELVSSPSRARQVETPGHCTPKALPQ